MRFPSRSQWLHVFSLLLTLLAGLMAYSDQFHPFLPPKFADYWPLFIATASFLRGIVSLLGDFLDDFQINQSFRVVLISALLLPAFLFFVPAGCAPIAAVFTFSIALAK